MSLSTRLLVGTGAVMMAAGAVLFAQVGDAAKVMADMRKALGGEQKFAAVKSLSATGKSQRASGETSTGGDYELMLELPDKYFTKQIMAETPFGAIAIAQGFNGAGLIQNTEAPPQMSGPGRMIIRASGSSLNPTPEPQAADRARQVVSAKSEFARVALGMLGETGAAFPLEFTYSGTAESPDGKAVVIGVKGPADFAGKLFVDQKSHLPLMFSWMAKEPMQVSTSTSRSVGGGGSATTFTSANPSMSNRDQDKMVADMQERMKEAEAKRKLVEYRMFYSDYRSVDGIQLPHHFQESVGATPSTEITIDKYKVDPKIDPKKFETVK